MENGIFQKGTKIEDRHGNVFECIMAGDEEKKVNNLFIRCSKKTGEPLTINEKNLLGISLWDGKRIVEGKNGWKVRA